MTHCASSLTQAIASCSESRQIRIGVANALAAMRPAPKTTPREWADRFRVVPKGTSQDHGRWRPHPFQIAPLEAIGRRGVDSVLYIGPSQIAGKTEILLNTIGHFTHADPSPQIFVTYSVDMATRCSKHRVAPMIRQVPELRARVKDARSRDSGNTILDKEFDGGQLTLVGANSAGGLAMYPKRVAMFDEVDRYPESAGIEGDSIEIALARTAGFRNAVVVYVTSPGDKKVNRSWRLWKLTDQQEWSIPCGDCGTFQAPRWAQVHWDNDTDGTPLTETAHYVCDHCGSVWTERDRWRACARGKFIATAPFKGRHGFRLNALGVAGRSLAKIVDHWLRVQGNPNELKVFTNTVLSEWWESAESVDDDALYARAQRDNWLPAPRIDVPAGGAVLTLGVDIQKDRVEYEVVVWGLGEESWSVAYGVIPGDVRQDPHVLGQQLDAILVKPWIHASGHPLWIRAACIDANYASQAVYRYTAPRQSLPTPAGKSRFVFAVKGISRHSEPVWPAKPTRTKRRKRGDVPTNLWLINVDAAKMQVLGRLGITDPGPGYCHFPISRPREYYKQLTSETYELRWRAGRQAVVWSLKSPGARNEPFDCRVYAYSAMVGLQTSPFLMDLTREVRAVEGLAHIAPSDPSGGGPASPPRAPVQPRRRRVTSRGYEA